MERLVCPGWVVWVIALGGQVALGSSFGPVYGTSGGPLGMGQSCTTCHGFASGPGSTRIFGLPAAYEPGVAYDLSVRIADPTKQSGGFLLSVEANDEIVGDLVITDPANTMIIPDNVQNEYVGHTFDGYQRSIADWAQNGNAAEYSFRWVAPNESIGPITFYAAGNAADDDFSPFGDTIYLETVIVEPLVAGDGDDDGDADFADFARLQECFDVVPVSADCAPLDLSIDGLVDEDDYALFDGSMTGPTALGPSAYRHARPGRGSKLYDKWWVVTGAPTPPGEHPLYPPDGQATGSSTYRCKECHGWDYKGADGAYGSGSHYTGIRGVFETTKSAQQIFELLRGDSVPNGHGLAALGLTEDDTWDLVKFLLEFQADTDDYIAPDTQFMGDIVAGEADYVTICSVCHGLDGTALNFGSPESPEYVGTVARHNPWEFLHKVRAGQPTHPMPSYIDLGWSAQRAADLGAFAATLPTE